MEDVKRKLERAVEWPIRKLAATLLRKEYYSNYTKNI